MIRLAYDALRTTPVATDPFPHVVVPNFVPPDELAKVLPGLPAITKRGSFPISALKIRGFAADVIQGLEGRTFRTAVAEKFKLDLNDAPTMVTLRGQTTDRDGHIHTDSKAKRVTVLLYLNPAREAWTKHDGCLRLLRGPKDLEDFAVEVPPVNGTLLVFPNGPTTWHGHKTHTGQRYVIQLNYMTNDGVARSELRRHQVSAFVKRLTGPL